MSAREMYFQPIGSKSDGVDFTREDVTAKIDSIIQSIQNSEKKLEFYQRKLEELNEKEKVNANEENSG